MWLLTPGNACCEQRATLPRRHFRLLDVEPRKTLELSWRWKVASSLTANRNERSKDGDDYAARVLLTFGSGTFSRSTRGLCYVWAAGEPVGAVFRSPHLDNVATIVLERGNEKSGEWILEQRDVWDDFQMGFGRPPEGSPGAIAVIVDTDDTQSSSIAWFDDVRINEGHLNSGRRTEATLPASGPQFLPSIEPAGTFPRLRLFPRQ